MQSQMTFTAQQKSLIHSAIKCVASACDGAIQQDGHGFNGGDAEFGRSLAERGIFSDRQAAAGLKMVLKYKRQIGDELHAQLKELSGAPENRQTAGAPGGDGASHGTVAPEFTPFDLSALQWSEPKKVSTRNGEKLVSEADPSPGFWDAWRADKEGIKSQGISVGKNPRTGCFCVTRWTELDGTQAPKKAPEPPAKIELPEITLESWIEQKLYDYQRPSARAIIGALQTYGSALDGSDTGAGKTAVAIAAAAQLKLRLFVVCPKAIIPGWQKLARYFGVECTAINYESLKTGNTPHGKWEKIPGPKNKTIEQWTWTIDPATTLLCIDEAQRCKNPKSQNAEMLIRAKEQGFKILAMSATVATNPLEMKAVGYTLGLFNNPGGFFKWIFANGCYKGRFGLEFSGGKEHIQKIHHEIYGTGKGSRIRVNEVPGFPETLIIPEVLDFNGASIEIQRAYDDMHEALSRLDEVEAKDRQNVILTEILRARQRSELLKVPTIVDMVNDAIDEGMSVGIFVNFDETLKQLAAKLKTSCTIHGGQSGDRGAIERQANIDAFQADRERKIICNIRAGGIGVSLHDVRGEFPRLALIMPTYSGQDLIQCFGRVRRAGGLSKSIQKVLFALGTIEEKAAQAVQDKIANIETLNDGDIRSGFRLIAA